MMKHVLTLGAAAMVSLSIVGGASAATLTLSGAGVAGALPAGWNPSNEAAINADGINNLTPITIYNTGNLGGLVAAPQNVNIDFRYMGSEAGFKNQVVLLFGDTVIFDNKITPDGTSTGAFPYNVGSNPGPVPFKFRAVDPGNLEAVNGGAIAAGLQIAFAQISSTVWYAFFDDGGAGPDADFDDIVLKITVSDTPNEVGRTPLPAAAWLFGTVLAGGAGVSRWRKRKAKVLAA